MDILLFDANAEIETERLILRCYQPGDGAMYYAVSQKNQDHLRQYESGNALMFIHSPAQAEEVVRSMRANWEAAQYFFVGAFTQDTREFAAQVYVGPHNWDMPEFEIGYIADRDHEGLGYVSEAVRAVLRLLFNSLGAHRVRLECSENNTRSIRLAERLGFTREGHLRETHRNPDGSYSGDLIYGLLSREYQALAGPGGETAG